MSTRVLLLPALCLVLSGVASGGTEEAGEAPGETRSVPAPSRKPSLDLDHLLRPPSPGRFIPEQRGGKDRRAWADAFASLRGEVADLEQGIRKAQGKIAELSRGAWGFAPAGGEAPTDPEVVRLRAQLRRDRRSLEVARRRLRDLEVEASLAGVPDDWKEPDL